MSSPSTSAAPPPGVGRVSRSAVRDTPAKRDALGFTPYVEAVAAFLDSPGTQPPFTLSLEGEWGSGKSSFMRQLADQLGSSKRSPSIVVSFNAWRFDKQDAMWAAFAQAVTTELRAQCTWPLRIRGALRLFRLRVNGPAGWLLLSQFLAAWLLLFACCCFGFYYLVRHSGTQLSLMTALFSKDTARDIPHTYRLLLDSGAWTGAAGVILAGLVKSGKWLKSWLFNLQLDKILSRPNYNKYPEFIESFHSDFGKTVRAYAGNRKVYVFVDDLDRCDLPKAAELMQAINLMIGEDDHLVFVLGLDREKVAAAIAAKYKDLLPFIRSTGGDPTTLTADQRLSFGYEYLEKFIQLSFRIPMPDDDSVMQHFIEKLTPEKAATAEENTVGSRTSGRIYNRIESGEDSQEIVGVVLMVRHLLGNNPRRLKQFLNAYRLALYLASSQGLFDEDSVTGTRGLTLQQLGKLIALNMRFPQLAAALLDGPRLLAEVEAYLQYLPQPGGRPPQGQEPPLWLRLPAALELLQFGLDSADAEVYSLKNVDVSAILRVMPAVPNPTEGQSPTPRPAAPTTAPLPQSEAMSMVSEVAEPLEWYDSSTRRVEPPVPPKTSPRPPQRRSTVKK